MRFKGIVKKGTETSQLICEEFQGDYPEQAGRSRSSSDREVCQKADQKANSHQCRRPSC